MVSWTQKETSIALPPLRPTICNGLGIFFSAGQFYSIQLFQIFCSVRALGLCRVMNFLGLFVSFPLYAGNNNSISNRVAMQTCLIISLNNIAILSCSADPPYCRYSYITRSLQGALLFGRLEHMDVIFPIVKGSSNIPIQWMSFRMDIFKEPIWPSIKSLNLSSKPSIPSSLSLRIASKWLSHIFRSSSGELYTIPSFFYIMNDLNGIFLWANMPPKS